MTELRSRYELDGGGWVETRKALMQGLDCKTCGAHTEAATADWDYDDWDTDELAQLFVALDDEIRLLRKWRADIETELAGVLDEMVTVGNAAVVVDRVARISDSAGTVRDKVYPSIRRFLIDPETQERVEAVTMDDVRELLGVRSQIRKLRPFGVSTEWRTTVKVIR